LLLLVAFFASVAVGSVHIGIKDVVSSLFSSTQYSYIIRNIRLPRSLGSALCGVLLALSGVAFQTSFRNPLADPYLLGVSSGSTFAIALGTLLGLVLQEIYSLPLLAFLGGLGASFLTLSIGRRHPSTIILCGIPLSSHFSALTSLLIYHNRRSLQGVYFWTMGSFSAMTRNKVMVLSVVTLFVLFYMVHSSQKMDLLLIDDSSARSLGLEPERSRRSILLVATVATAAAVSYCGIIGFAGILAPHLARKLVGNTHKKLIPGSAFLGAFLLLLADTLSRTLISPSEIPVGVITSLLGCPMFLILAFKGAHHE
ncbi:MAG: iron ABC transporter permease, partial [Spirochaetales bacterium]|nr:iron ABC transporter permease [Candidatus Physcosoma equi]